MAFIRCIDSRRRGLLKSVARTGLAAARWTSGIMGVRRRGSLGESCWRVRRLSIPSYRRFSGRAVANCPASLFQGSLLLAIFCRKFSLCAKVVFNPLVFVQISFSLGLASYDKSCRLSCCGTGLAS